MLQQNEGATTPHDWPLTEERLHTWEQPRDEMNTTQPFARQAADPEATGEFTKTRVVHPQVKPRKGTLRKGHLLSPHPCESKAK